jgi:cytochrome o ubiquinol oxidase subunit 2
MVRSSLLTRRLRPALSLAALTLGGCTPVLFDSAGTVARQQAAMIYWSVALMLLIIIPVMALTVLFAWRYRETNEAATYEPDWDHSTGLELVIWSAPLLIIIALGALTWSGTHLLDPYRPLDPAQKAAVGDTAAPAVKPLEVQVVSLDWKWLFIYPEQGIATVNRLVLPVDRPVHFRLTSASVMNTFWVPAMAGMVYTMPGMETQLHAAFDRGGDYEGLSANYSGAGFSDMHFRTLAVAPQQFESWVAGVRGQPRRLDQAAYLQLEKPSEKIAPIGFGGIDPALYSRIVAMCTKPGVPCARHSDHRMSMPTANDRPAKAGDPEGALLREPGEKGSSPHLTKPRGGAPGTAKPGDPANRNMTLLDPRAVIGARTADA